MSLHEPVFKAISVCFLHSTVFDVIKSQNLENETYGQAFGLIVDASWGAACIPYQSAWVRVPALLSIPVSH